MSPPDWFVEAVNEPYTTASVEVEGANIVYQQWQANGKPGLLLVHGHAAHAHWWDFIAPQLGNHYDVVAINLSGAGDSDHRQRYSASQFGREIVAVAAAAGITPAILVGHSFGGSMARIAAWQHPEVFRATVLIDSVLSRSRARRGPMPEPNNRMRYYPTLAAGKKRFRLRPPQPRSPDYILDYIAGHSLAHSSSGYHFKLDQAVFAKMTEAEEFPDAYTMVQEITHPVGFVYGELSRFFPAAAIADLQTLFAPERLEKVAAAYHHLFLDQPLAFVDQLQRLIERLR